MPATKKTNSTKKTSKKSSTRTKSSTTKKTTSRRKSARPIPVEIPTLPIETDVVVDPSIDKITSNISNIESALTDPDSISGLQGGFNISRKVLARIASMAADEIEGLEPPRRDPINRFFETIQGRVDGIRIDIGTTEAAVDMLVRVQYGSHIPEITSRLREKIARRIHDMTGLRVVEVNIRVQDVTPLISNGPSN